MSALSTIEWAVEPPVDAQWELPPDATVLNRPTALERVVAVIGPPGKDATRSTDAGNQLTTGTDGGLFMGHPQLSTAQW